VLLIYMALGISFGTKFVLEVDSFEEERGRSQVR
jgi:hypothetical protein